MSLSTIFATEVTGALIQKVATSLLDQYVNDNAAKSKLGNLMPLQQQVVDGITRMLKEHALDFGESKQVQDFSDALVGRVANAIAAFQENSAGKLPVTGLFDANTITRLLQRPACGGIEGRKLDPGPPIGVLSSGRHVMRYFLEDLPDVGNLKAATKAFMLGVECWTDHLNLEIGRAPTKDTANLVVSVETLRADPSVLALTDVGSGGPNQGGQLRMIFDRAEQWTPDVLQATTAHELGHALGIRHADVRVPGSLMNDTLDMGVTTPQKADVDAAVAKGWMRR